MGVVIGVDAHKKTHTLVALDGNGRKLAEKTVEAPTPGTPRRCAGHCSSSATTTWRGALKIAVMCPRGWSAAWSTRASELCVFPPD